MTKEREFQMERNFFYYEVRTKPFSVELLKKAMEYERIKYADVVLLQSQLETGFYTSDIFLNGNNLFGMKYPKYRRTIATGTYKGHSQYNHWSDSVIDYAIWQEWYLSLGWRIAQEIDDTFYLVFLDCVKYAEDPRYIPKLVELSQRDLS